MICRDRAGAYADGARQGASDADQVADRWHIYHNLCEHVDKTAARHRSCLEEPTPAEPEEPAVPEAPQVPDLQQAAIDAAARRVEESALAVRTRQRYDQVQSLKAQGKGIKPIKRETGLAKERPSAASTTRKLSMSCRSRSRTDARRSWTSTSPT